VTDRQANQTVAWLRPFLDRCKVRPGAFLGSEDVRVLCAYIRGYSCAREDLGFAPFGEGEETLLAGFDRWLVAEKGGFPNMGWAFNVAQIDESETNVRTFFRLWEEFTASTPDA
jgi:hypothetical protein